MIEEMCNFWASEASKVQPQAGQSVPRSESREFLLDELKALGVYPKLILSDKV